MNPRAAYCSPTWAFAAVKTPSGRPPRSGSWAATIPHYYKGRFPGEGSAHFPFPSGFGLVNRILSGLLRPPGNALMVLEQAPLDQGYACESFDAETAEARTGVGFAALAGLIANALASGKDHRPTL